MVDGGKRLLIMFYRNPEVKWQDKINIIWESGNGINAGPDIQTCVASQHEAARCEHFFGYL